MAPWTIRKKIEYFSSAQRPEPLMAFALNWLRIINAMIGKACMALGIIVVAIMVVALTASAATRYLTGTGYDWLIELPPMLIPWLVFPLLGPLLKAGAHITVDVTASYVGPVARRWLRLASFLITFLAACVFLEASFDAVALFRQLGQVVELEIEFPIWYLYAAFPTGFVILALFALELFLTDLLNPDDTGSEQDPSERGAGKEVML